MESLQSGYRASDAQRMQRLLPNGYNNDEDEYGAYGDEEDLGNLGRVRDVENIDGDIIQGDQNQQPDM